MCRWVRVALFAAFGLLTGACFGPSHPDYGRYEYLYIDGAFQPPHLQFPSGVQRAGWKCYDAKIGKEFDCTFVRGGWDQFRYIYRERR